jgi:hypothetical protein
LTFSYAQIQSKIEKSAENNRLAVRLNLEISRRIQLITEKVDNLDSSATIEQLHDALSLSIQNPRAIFPEFQERSLSSLILELHSVTNKKHRESLNNAFHYSVSLEGWALIPINEITPVEKRVEFVKDLSSRLYGIEPWGATPLVVPEK